LHPWSNQLQLSKLKEKADSAYSLLEAIRAWTGDRLSLAQALCQPILDSQWHVIAGEEAQLVEQLVRNNLIHNWEIQTAAEPLRILRKNLLENQKCEPFYLLRLYRQVLLAEEIPGDSSPEQAELVALGLVDRDREMISVSNRIYKTVFNCAWVEKELIRLHPWSKQLQLFKLEERAFLPYSLLEAIHDWTGEQISLVKTVWQLLIDLETSLGAGEEAARVDWLIQKRLINDWETQPAAEPLREMRQALLENKQCDSFSLLRLYRQVLRQEPLPVTESAEEAELLDLGLIVERDKQLRVSSRIYKEVFDEKWTTQELEKQLRSSTIETAYREDGKTAVKKRKKKPGDRKKLIARSIFLVLGLTSLLALGAIAIAIGLRLSDYLQLETRFKRANELLSQGEYQQAVEDYDAVLAIDGNYFEAWTNRGYAYARLHEYENMFSSCNTATLIEPQAIYAWNCKGEALHNLSKDYDAIAAFDRAIERAIEINSNDPIFTINKSEALMSLGRTEEAIAAIDESIALLEKSESVNGRNPATGELSVAWSYKGRALRDAKNYPEALQAFESALNYSPNYFPALLGKGTVFQNLKQYDEALDEFDNMLANDKLTDQQKAQAWYYKGLIFCDRQQYDEATAAFDEALNLKPQYQAAQKAAANCFNKG
jgi:tetratricopeptide (TPR) repeat protein